MTVCAQRGNWVGLGNLEKLHWGRYICGEHWGMRRYALGNEGQEGRPSVPRGGNRRLCKWIFQWESEWSRREGRIASSSVFFCGQEEFTKVGCLRTSSESRVDVELIVLWSGCRPLHKTGNRPGSVQKLVACSAQLLLFWKRVPYRELEWQLLPWRLCP